jgi:hypothetical protein
MILEIYHLITASTFWYVVWKYAYRRYTYIRYKNRSNSSLLEIHRHNPNRAFAEKEATKQGYVKVKWYEVW